MALAQRDFFVPFKQPVFCLSGLTEKLSEMSAKLEEIQKALDMYLETKRQLFPRFYFLSNDDVLEILGQSQNPEAMQPHLKKCFDNIKSLRMEKAGNTKIHNAALLMPKSNLRPFSQELYTFTWLMFLHLKLFAATD